MEILLWCRVATKNLQRFNDREGMGDGPLQRFFVAILLRCHEYTRLSIINKEHEWNHFDKKFCYLILLAIFVCSRFMESFGLEIFLSPEKRRMILEEGDNC